MSETLLSAVPGWSPDLVERLQGAWITTAEQVVAIGATADGLQSLSEQLQVSREEAGRLLDLARRALPSEVLAEMEQPVDTSNYGLGVIRPRKEE